MHELIFHNVRALQPGEGIVADTVHVCDGKIVAMAVGTAMTAEKAECIDGGGRLLTPGLIDIHTHAIGRFAFEASPEALVAGARLLARYGTTCVFPTLYQVMRPSRLSELEALSAALLRVEGACMPALHLEGPHLAVPGAGADAMPGDLGFLAELLAATGGRVAAMSVSPETPQILPVIERLCECGIVPFLTHTRASVAETEAAIAAGARHATHFYDVFPLPPETEPGVRPVGAVEAILADGRCSVDFIADGVHVHPTAIRAAVAAKGSARVLLATDANVGAGEPDGLYDSPWGFPIRVARGDAARMHRPGHPLHGASAGSTLTMDRGVANLLKWLAVPAAQVWAMATSNPARLLRLNDKGVLRAGADADLVLWDDAGGELRVVQTWVGGQCVYRA